MCPSYHIGGGFAAVVWISVTSVTIDQELLTISLDLGDSLPSLPGGRQANSEDHSIPTCTLAVSPALQRGNLFYLVLF